MITTYNWPVLGDILMIFLGPNPLDQRVESQNGIVRISDAATGQTTGFNIFGRGEELGLAHTAGQLFLNQAQIDQLNRWITAVGFADRLTVSPAKITIGYVASVEPHPDSDHLQVTQTQIGADQTLQIVSGSPNMKAGIKVVVAQPGAMMPSGNLIWDGALRGVPSAGMIVSGRELGLPGAPDRPGALVLPADFGQVGDIFDFEAAQSLYPDQRIDLDY